MVKKTLIGIGLVIAIVLAITLPGAVLADDDGVQTYIHIEKYVSVDGGVTWLEADVAPGPTVTVGQEVKFKVRVTNGTVSGYTHENITVTDSDPSIVFTGVVTTLLPGEWDESDVVTVTALAGLHYNEATVTADPICGRVTDSNGAYYFGEEEEGGDEGCTPGFWKNNWCKWDGSAWEPTGYAGGDLFSSVFDRTIEVTVKRHVVTDPTLYQALNAQGGGINALARHAVAALLNAASPDVDYAMSKAAVISAVQAAIDSGEVQALADDLADYNEAGCPIDQHEDCSFEFNWCRHSFKGFHKGFCWFYTACH